MLALYDIMLFKIRRVRKKKKAHTGLGLEPLRITTILGAVHLPFPLSTIITIVLPRSSPIVTVN